MPSLFSPIKNTKVVVYIYKTLKKTPFVFVAFFSSTNQISLSFPFMSDHYFKPPFMEEDSPLFKDYLQDFHHFDHPHQFHNTTNNNGSSSNPIFGVPDASNFESFDVFPYGSSTNIDVYDYECKPLIDNNGGHGQVMDNFGSGGYLNNNLPQRNHPFNINPLNFEQVKHIDFVVPDEVSSIDVTSVCTTKNRGFTSTRKPLKGKKKPHVVKGQWTASEDSLLIQLVEKYGIRKWSHIAQMLPGRIGKQCRERWHNHLRPDIKKDIWSEAEDRVLIDAHSEIGNKWAEIAKRLPGRTENSIKNHWNATKRRQYSKRKCRSKYPKGTILQDYIKSLNLNSPKYGEKSTTSTTPSADDTNFAMKSTPTPTTTTTNTTDQPGQALDLCSDDRLVPSYELNEVLDFAFDENMFQENCSIDSLLEDMSPRAPVINVDDKINFGSEVPSEMDNPLVDYEVKRELDLVEMMQAVRP